MIASYRQKVTLSKLEREKRTVRFSIPSLTTPLDRLNSHCHRPTCAVRQGLQRGSARDRWSSSMQDPARCGINAKARFKPVIYFSQETGTLDRRVVTRYYM